MKEKKKKKVTKKVRPAKISPVKVKKKLEPDFSVGFSVEPSPPAPIPPTVDSILDEAENIFEDIDMISLRCDFASKILQGLLAGIYSDQAMKSNFSDPSSLTTLAVQYADALIEKLK